jgi:hypothetical protein
LLRATIDPAMIVRLAGFSLELRGQRPSLPFCLGARDVALGLASPLAERDDAVEAAVDCVQKRVVAERELAPPQHGEGGVVRVHVEKIGEARRAVDERLRAHEPVVAAGQMRPTQSACREGPQSARNATSTAAIRDVRLTCAP